MKTQSKSTKILVVVLMLSIIFVFIIKEHKKQIDCNYARKIHLSSLFPKLESPLKYRHFKSKKVMVVYYNSSCELCINEINFIQKYYRNRDSLDVVFLSKEDKDSIVSFSLQFSQVKNFHFSQVGNWFNEQFETNNIPSIFFYDYEGIPKYRFLGAINPDTLIKYIP